MSNPEFAKSNPDLLTSRMRIGVKFPYDRPADRARACANACEGIDDPRHGELRMLRKYCAALSAALEDLYLNLWRLANERHSDG